VLTMNSVKILHTVRSAITATAEFLVHQRADMRLAMDPKRNMSKYSPGYLAFT